MRILSLLLLFAIVACTQEKETAITKTTPVKKKLNHLQRVDAYYKMEYLRTRNPKTGKMEYEKLADAFQYMKAKRSNLAAKTDTAIAGVGWTERGPWQVGGRTRALLWQQRGGGNYRVWSGSATGGLWFCDNIESSGNPTWQKVNDMMDNLSISSIIADPANASHLLLSTGEYVGSGYRGIGVYESYDNGVTWNTHPATNNKNLGTVLRILIDRKGALWAATQRFGLCKYDVATNSWQSIIAITNTGNQVCYDLKMNGRGDLFSVVRRDSATHQPMMFRSDYNSATNSYSSWNTLPANFLPNTSRVEIGVSQTAAANACYFLAVNASTGNCHQIGYSQVRGNAFGYGAVPVVQDNVSTTDTFTRKQGAYDLVCTVDPNNEQTLYIGGINWCKSTNGGSSFSQMTWWTNAPSAGWLVHADQHVMEFKPGSSQVALLGNDGGVYYTSNVISGFTAKNEGYRVTQFYHAANNVDNNVYFLGGTQDNGTWRFTGATGAYPTLATGGDGAFCHIDHSDPNLQIGAYVYSTYHISTDGGNSFSSRTFRAPNGDDRGWFINPTIFERHSRKLFGAWSADTIFRYNDVSTAGSDYTRMYVQDMAGGMATHLMNAPAENSDIIFVGTDNGRVIKITNAGTSSATQYLLMKDSVPYGWITGIAQDYRNKDHLLVTFGNYGVKSVWETKDKGANWKSVEGNLPDMPVRWCIFHPDDPNRALIATDLGVWSTDNLSSDTVDWDPTNSSLANVEVDMIRMGMENKQEYDQYYNNSELYVVAATFGRGLYTTTLPKIPNFRFNGAASKTLYEKATVNNGCVRYTDYPQYVSMTKSHTNNIIVAIDTLPGFGAKRGKDFDILVNNVNSNQLVFDLNTNYPREFVLRVYDDALLNGTRKFALKLRVVNDTKEVITDPYRYCDTFFIQDNDFEPDFTVSTKEIVTPLSDGDESWDVTTPFSYSYKYTSVEFKYDSSFLLQAGLKPNVPISSFALKMQAVNAPVPAYNLVAYGVHGSYNNTSWPFIEGTYTTVTNNVSVQDGWNTFNFSGGTTWNRSQNFLINMYVNNSVCPNFSLGGHRIFGNSGFGALAPNRTVYRYGNDNFSCGTPYNSAPLVTNTIPQIKFTQLYYSESAKGTGDSSLEKLGPYETVYFKSSPTVVLAKVENLSAHDYQCVKLQIDRSGESTNTFWNNNPANNLLSKTFKVIPTVNNSTGHYRITLYYSPAEARAWMQATGMAWSAIQMVKTPGEIKSVNPSNIPQGIVVTNNIFADSVGTGDGLTYRVQAEFFNGFSGFGIGVPGNSPLPLTWISFDAVKENKQVRLNWTTANETNTAGFTIERSSNGIAFSKLEGFYPAKQQALNNYTALHAAPVPGWNYYRIRQTDKDGKYTLSNTRSIYFDAKHDVGVYPNPAHEYIFISSASKIVSVQLIDARGTVIKTINGNVQQIPVSGIAKGVYNVRVQLEGNKITTVPVVIN